MSRRLAGMLLLALLVLAGLSLVRPGASPIAQSRNLILSSASLQHPAGTDDLGRDRLARTSAALLLGITGSALASAVTTALAAAVGSAAAFAPAGFCAALLLAMDVTLTLPWLFLLMMVRAGLPLNASPLATGVTTFALLAALGWPACARAVYRGTLRIRGSDAVLFARAGGLRRGQVLRLYALPNLRPLLLPQFLVGIPAFLIAEANLGTLGLGIPEPLPSFGTLLLEMGNSALVARSDWVFLPLVLLCIMLLLLENLSGDTALKS